MFQFYLPNINVPVFQKVPEAHVCTVTGKYTCKSMVLLQIPTSVWLLRMSYTIYISVFIYQLFVIPMYGVSVAETAIYYSCIYVWGIWVLSQTLHSREDNSLCIEDMTCHQNWLIVINAFFFWIWNTCLMKMVNIIPDDINNVIVITNVRDTWLNPEEWLKLQWQWL